MLPAKRFRLHNVGNLSHVIFDTYTLKMLELCHYFSTRSSSFKPTQRPTQCNAGSSEVQVHLRSTRVRLSLGDVTSCRDAVRDPLHSANCLFTHFCHLSPRLKAVYNTAVRQAPARFLSSVFGASVLTLEIELDVFSNVAVIKLIVLTHLHSGKRSREPLPLNSIEIVALSQLSR